ncbi:GntR family transcriptional regulator [Pseudonocardia sp. HH130629-09]|uniref:GntR family transcriptional regulator n=1 Tax=Pseudonocardia sp. HH130629-09 TaxID=1641402 RepID=UPI0006CB3F7F|nr:GntR family transcriptional regulator [Pseudonocardia sp. HH130629-09]ALE81839.1 GntR family transcriptional regulator [Pseudonocardia sp. HH130629-09]
MIEYRIDRRSGVAPFAQIVLQTKEALLLGTLQPNDRLPTAREVVEATAINPNTVLKAYRELERDGLVEAKRGVGTFIRSDAVAAGPGANSPLRGELEDWTARAVAAGLSRAEIDALVRATLDRHYD